MKTIAFKRAKHPFLHPDFIGQYIEASKLESLDGWETLLEDRFQEALMEGQKKQEEYMKRLIKDVEMADKAKKDAETARKLRMKEEEHEYKRFKAWQKHSGVKR